MAEQRRLSVILEGDSGQLVGTLRAAADEIERVGNTASAAGEDFEKAGKKGDEAAKRWENAGKVLGAAAAAAVVGIAGLVAAQISAADQAGEMAARLSVSTEWITGMGYAAKMSGTDVQVLERGLGALTGTMAKAAGGSQEQQRLFAAIGVSATDVTGQLKPLDQILPQIADKFLAFQDGPAEAALATRLFGDAGRELLPMLNQGAAGMDQLRARAAELGMVIGDDTAARAGELNDQIDELVGQVRGVGTEIAAALLPMLVEAATATAQWLQEARSDGSLDLWIQRLAAVAKVLARATGYIFSFTGAVIDFVTGTSDADRAADSLANTTARLATATGAGIEPILAEAEARRANTQAVLDETRAKLEAAKAAATREDDSFFGWGNRGVGGDIRNAEMTGMAEEIARLNAELTENQTAVTAAQARLDNWRKGLDAAAGSAGKLTPPVVQSTSAINAQARAAKENEQRMREQARAQEEAARAAQFMNDIWMQTSGLSLPMQQAISENNRLMVEFEHNAQQMTQAGYSQGDMNIFLQQTLDRLRQQMEGNIQAALREQDVRGRLLGDMDAEIALLRMSADARRVEVVVRQAQAEAQRMNKALSAEEVEQLRLEVAQRLATIDALEQQQARMEKVSDGMASSMYDFSRAVLDDFGNLDQAIEDLGDSMLDVVKDFVAQAIAEFFKLEIVNPLLNDLFGGSLQEGGSRIGGFFGGGGAGGGGLFGNLFGGGGSGSGFLANIGQAMPIIAAIMAGMQFNNSLYDQGWRPGEGDKPAGAAYYSLATLTPTALLSGVADRFLRGLGLDGRTASMLSGSAVVQRLFGRSAPELTNSETTLTLGPDGGSASARYRTLERGGVFRSDRRRWHTGDAEEATEAAHGLYDAVRQAMIDDARALQSEAPAVMSAAIRTVQEFDKDGKVKATRHFVDILGRTFEEKSAEDAQLRVFAEARIATIDAALGTTVAAVAAAGRETVGAGGDAVSGSLGGIGDSIDDLVKSVGSAQGEASAYAERWRDDAKLLADGAAMLLLAATDIRAGTGLLGEGGSLTQVADLVTELAQGGESLAAAYQRIAASTQLLEDALDLSGVTLDKTREELVRFAVDITTAAGGLDRATDLWTTFFQAYYSEAERAELAMARARENVARQFADVALNPDDFSGPGGMAQFRALFNQMLPTLSAEAVVEWLEAAEALAMLISLQSEYNEVLDMSLGAVTSLKDLMAVVQEELAEFAPPQSFAERMAAITQATEELITRAVELGAAEAELAQIRALGQRRLDVVVREQQAALAEYAAFMQQFRSAGDAGLSEFQQSLRAIGREAADAAARANELAIAAGLSGATAEDLADIQMRAAEQMAAAALQLEASILDLAGQLGYLEETSRSWGDTALGIAHSLAQVRTGAPELDPERFSAATRISAQLRELAEFAGETTLDTMARLRIPLDRIVADFGVALDSIDRPEVFDRFLGAARVLGVEAEDAARVLGINVGQLSDAAGLLNDAFERALDRLPDNFQAALEPLLRDYETASTPEARAQARNALVSAIDALPPNLRAILAPFLDEIDTTAIAEQQLSVLEQQSRYLSASVDHLAAIRGALGNRNAPPLESSNGVPRPGSTGSSEKRAEQDAMLELLREIANRIDVLERTVSRMGDRALVGINQG